MWSPLGPNVIYVGKGEADARRRKLNNLIAALAPVVAATDTAPTAQSYAVFTDLSARLDRQLDRLDAIMEREVAAFNRALEDQRVPAVRTRTRRR